MAGPARASGPQGPGGGAVPPSPAWGRLLCCSAPPHAIGRGHAQLQRWVLYTWSNANLEKPAHLVNTLRLLEDIIRSA